MTDLLVLVLAAGLLLICRWWIQKRVQGIVLLLGGSRKLAIYAYSLLFLPGVMAHEISHFLMASLLAVRTGEVRVLPEIDEDEEEERVALGSVQVAKTDFVRGSLIGVAPFVMGSLLLYLIVHVYFSALLDFNGLLGFYLMLAAHNQFLTQPITWLWLYAVVALANTMFSSREDARSWPILFVVLLFMAVVLVKSGSGGAVMARIAPAVSRFSEALSRTFVFVIMVDLVMMLVLAVIDFLLQKVTRRRLVYGKH